MHSYTVFVICCVIFNLVFSELTEEVILSYSSSPKIATITVPSWIEPIQGMAVKVEVTDPEEDGGGHANEVLDEFIEEEKGNIALTIMLSAGAIVTKTVEVRGNTEQTIKFCFDPKPKGLADTKTVKVSLTSDLVNDKNIKMSLVKCKCETSKDEEKTAPIILSDIQTAKTDNTNQVDVITAVGVVVIAVLILILLFFQIYVKYIENIQNNTKKCILGEEDTEDDHLGRDLLQNGKHKSDKSPEIEKEASNYNYRDCVIHIYNSSVINVKQNNDNDNMSNCESNCFEKATQTGVHAMRPPPYSHSKIYTYSR